MHPPAFDLDHTLADWPACCLEVRCPCSPHMIQLAARTLTERHGNRRFRDILGALRCSKCRGKPGPVYLVAGFHRTFARGPGADWALELVPAPG